MITNSPAEAGHHLYGNSNSVGWLVLLIQCGVIVELFQFACKFYMIISSLLNGYIEHEGNIKLEIVTELPLDYNLTWNIDKNQE